MKLNATVFFRATMGYSNQNTFPVVGPSHRFDPEQSLVAHLRDPEYLDSFKPVDVDGSWGQERFVMKMVMPHHYNPTRTSDYCIVYGFTEPCAQLNNDTKIYFSRVTSLRRHEALVESDVVQYLHRHYDLLILPAHRDFPTGDPSKKAQYSISPHTVLQRIGADNAFGRMGLSHPHPPINVIGRPNGMKAVNITDIDVVRYADKLEEAVREALKHACSGDGVGTDDAELYSLMADVVRPVVFEQTRIFDEIGHNTNYMQDGFITYDELTKVLGDDTVFRVDYDVLGSTKMSTQSLLGERIFNDHLKMLVATASDLGMEKIVSEWYNDSGVTEEIVGMTEPLLHGMVWVPPAEGESFDDPLNEIIKINSEEPAPVDSREFYGVNSFRVKIHLDFAGDINAEVSINGGEPEFFTKPAFALAAGSGMLVSEKGMQDICEIVECYADHKIHGHVPTRIA